MAIFRLLLAVFLLAPVASPSAAQNPRPEGEPQQPPVRWAAKADQQDVPSDVLTIPLELLANRPIVRLTVNGHGPFPFLIAPDAAATGIDAELAKLLGIRDDPARADVPAASVEFALVAASPIVAALTPPAAFTVPVRIVQVSAFMPDFAAAAGPRGIISPSAWPDRLVTIDYAQYRVTIEEGALPEPDGKDVFPLAESGELRLPLLIGDRTVDCRIDPLFQGGLLLPAAYTENFLFDKAMRDLGPQTTRLGALHMTETRLMGDVKLGPFLLRTPAVLLARTESALIGAQWLAQFAVTYDVAHARARLERLRDASR